MELLISPPGSIKKSDLGKLNKIVSFAKKLLEKNNILLPQKILFYNSFDEFIKKVLPEVENYGFNRETSEEIIKCALNNGTYGTINFQEDSIIEMNFNPFNNGKYKPLDFLELIIHEALHLHLSKKMDIDINNSKFKFKDNNLISKPEIIQLDEGYAEFMTNKILQNEDVDELKNIEIPSLNAKGPGYKKDRHNIKIDQFDKMFEDVLIFNRKKGMNMFEKLFPNEESNQVILNFTIKHLKDFI